MSRCSQCDYVPLLQYTSVRPPPWTDDDHGLNFFTCRHCGAMSVQRYDQKTSYGQVWMLEHEALGLFRSDTPPQQILNYIKSSDFRTNRVVMESVYHGWARSSLGLPVVVRGLFDSLESKSDRGLLVLLRCLSFGLKVLVERAAHRNPTSLDGTYSLVELLQGRARLNLSTTDEATARLLALDCLSCCVHPSMTPSFDEGELYQIEEVLDHGFLLELSRARVRDAARSWEKSEGAKLLGEVQFLHGLFERRNAWLTREDSLFLWQLLREISAHAPRTPAIKNLFLAIQLLLEEQLVALGLERITWTEEGKTFMSPRRGWIYHIPLWAPKVQVFKDLKATRPLQTFQNWEDVIDFCRM